MPAKSEKQQIAARMALAAKHGKIPKSKLKKSSRQMAEMDESDLEHFAKERENRHRKKGKK